MAGIMAGGAIGTAVLAIMEDAPEIDPTTIMSNLDQTSSIYDMNGNLNRKDPC